MAYCSVAELKRDLGITVTDDDALLEDKIAEAQDLIDAHCGRRFEAESKTRYYESDALDPEDSNILILDDDLISITTLTNGDDSSTTIASTEYWLIDRNEGPPYYAIRLKSDSDDSWEWDTDCWVSVEGEWGWAERAPKKINLACKRWAAYLYHQKDAGGGGYETTVIPEAGVITQPTGVPVDVVELLKPFRRGVG